MSQILDLLRPGDILTHCYSGAPNIAGDVHQHRAGRQAAARGAGGEAARRGVRRRPRRRQLRLHGRRGGDRAGAGPDTISSDIHVFSGNTPGMPYLTWVMSKFLNMASRSSRWWRWRRSIPARVIDRAAEARHAAGRRAGRRLDARGGRRPGRVRRHAQQQARRARCTSSPPAPCWRASRSGGPIRRRSRCASVLDSNKTNPVVIPGLVPGIQPFHERLWSWWHDGSRRHRPSPVQASAGMTTRDSNVR